MKRNVLCGWKEIQEYLGLSKATILKRGYPVMAMDSRSPRVCADMDELDRHTERLFKKAKSYTPKSC